jgi:hypothetical protein
VVHICYYYMIMRMHFTHMVTLMGPGGKPPDKSLRSEAAAAPKLSDHALVSLFQTHMLRPSSASSNHRPLAPPPPPECIRPSFAASLSS